MLAEPTGEGFPESPSRKGELLDKLYKSSRFP